MILFAMLTCGFFTDAQPIDAHSNQPAVPFGARVRLEMKSSTRGVWTTDKDLGRLDYEELDGGWSYPGTLTIKVNTSVRYQRMKGFGGAFTDAATINLLKLPAQERERVLDWYYSPSDGIGYTVGRIPIASCDFSTYEYSYDDSPGDFALQNFSIDVDAASGKLELIRDALARTPELKLFGTPWSAPGWMKSGGSMVHGELKGNVSDPNDPYYNAWALYMVRFVSEYEKADIPIWGITVQNEPLGHVAWQSMHLSAEMERDFIKNHLGPALATAHPEPVV